MENFHHTDVYNKKTVLDVIYMTINEIIDISVDTINNFFPSIVSSHYKEASPPRLKTTPLFRTLILFYPSILNIHLGLTQI